MPAESPTPPDATAALTRALDLGTPGGARVAVKECLAVAGLPTRAGSAAFEDAPPATDHAAVVQALLDSGAQIIGLANMHELAYGMTGANAHTGTPQNPLWPDRIPGGSSSGSAVLVAQGSVDFAIGTDTGGSIRQPACCCGVFGLKPSFARISRAGALPVGSSLDCIGPFAQNMAMLTRAMQMLDPDFAPETCDSPPALAMVQTEAEADIQAALDAALTGLGDLPTVPLPGMEDAFAAGMTVIGAEIAAEFGALAASNATLGADIRTRVLAARDITGAQLAEAEAIRTRFTDSFDAALLGRDALILPTLPMVPPTWEQAQDPAHVLPLTRFVRPFNLSGHPALTIPILTADGLPAGLQIVGHKGADARLCAVASWICDQIPATCLVQAGLCQKETA
ncbi:amidase [Pseudooceanicola algae]|uniref:Glutamyl-tRNA(Gln) amidotransferase subunit A n=1 Tax=Pseudooceanicola algae TaxID=1537215 RepID=A0A418SH05_9RHOB|nr:amidase [Pseudooceanicola algae]QPM90333.1 Glutamyl-tRNA(Gln) amidotransferase subunit A [Pseudooceanicola algae]